MKTIGLIGGMSWESTAAYYRLLNEEARARLGGLHSAQILLYSVDFEPIEQLQHQGDWEGAARILTKAALRLQDGGADFFLICTNTMHRVAPLVEAAVRIPLLHIADPTAESLLAKGVQTVGLLGTAFTMEQEFYRGRLEQRHGLEVVTPSRADRRIVHDIIYQELCQGKIRQAAKSAYLRIIGELAGRGAEAVILGCTEIGLLVKQEDSAVPLYDTTALHAVRAMELALTAKPGASAPSL
ncbi:aspartate/glutamate racemase family protein [Desulfogranum mediterraneum]|uniref:aspartate/glutamate racemase family protein n=1 Tax=Desulfogranum mediterraneum TaxID=160661 RepID=UPI000490324C|nr:aspartate/glutamate racemase family protein [Desulfogranum mediterraneum]